MTSGRRKLGVAGVVSVVAALGLLWSWPTALGVTIGGRIGVEATPSPSATPSRAGPSSLAVRAASFDPADYLARYPDARDLARALTERCAANGVNTLYVNAYNVQYGANYRTAYRHNSESDYGRQDLLGRLLEAAHARRIQVVAAIYDHQHRGAWEAQPSWRAKTRSGSDYNPPRVDIQYFLSVGNPSARAWWAGFLEDLLRRYPALDGIELREPIVNWWGVSADYNPALTREFLAAHPGSTLGGETWIAFRRQSLTRFLRQEIRIVHRAHRFVHVTTVADAYGSGRLMSAEDEAHETGFDLDALLSGADRPDAVKVEIIWQQWARSYDYVVFTPRWTGQATREFLRQVHGRAPVVVHVELTEWPGHTVTLDGFHLAMEGAAAPGVAGVDFFTTFLADRKRAWPVIRHVYGKADQGVRSFTSRPRVLVIYDRGAGVPGAAPGLNDIQALFLANLLGHFPVDWEVCTMEGYRAGELADYDILFYEANVFGGASPVFLADVGTFRGVVVWIGSNLFQVADRLSLPLRQDTQDLVTGYSRLRYGGRTLPAEGSAIPTRVRSGAVVEAWLEGRAGRTPYAVRGGRFWYVAGSPFEAIETMNGRYLAFADLLHDMLGVPEGTTRRLAFLRVEDVNPLSDPDAVRRLADVFAARHVPFQIGFVPIYVDPTRGLEVPLSARPRMIAALRYAVSRGASIVLHGCTHQSVGVTGVDYEFWDPGGPGPLAIDSEPYVRGRVERALEEMWNAGFHPVAWSTPHYAASSFDYAIFGDYFTTFVGRRTYGVWAGSDYQQWMPYTVEDVHGAVLVPENLGYVRDPRVDLARMVRDATSLLSVRDAVAGGLLHLSVTPEQAGWLLDRLSGLGYGFLDLNELSTEVRTEETVQVTGSVTADIAVPSGWYLQQQVVGRGGALVDSALIRYASYARPSLSLGARPGGRILTLHVSASARGLPGPARLIGYPDVAPAGLLRAIGLAVGVMTLALAAVGLLLLVAAYGGMKARGGRGRGVEPSGAGRAGTRRSLR